MNYKQEYGFDDTLKCGKFHFDDKYVLLDMNDYLMI